MPLRIRGGSIEADAEVESLTKALRTTLRPLDYGAGGSFQLTSESGTMAAGLTGDAAIYSFRVASASLLVAVKRVKLSAWSLGTGFTAGVAKFKLMAARSWTVADTDGVTETITTNNGKLRSNMASIAALAEIRHSDTAAISAGTRTLDSQPTDILVAGVGTGQNTVFVATAKLFEKPPGEHPLVFVENEGLVVQATVPATGTWGFAITTEWDEVASY